eukprot:CAMPEP_0182893280 /NCGR_PEP_ID=MMETSP0034_2-20130328/24381_1 /TAXON_ID=156128 /ORGANISM="Nephroselmis pyriformis, Strain CCMP717" /LENGTH=176 /DNA_ID=CAMNT_0025027013 /DNA_START=24 /DNA_END=550 /DNA_ORIENTATION=-
MVRDISPFGNSEGGGSVSGYRVAPPHVHMNTPSTVSARPASAPQTRGSDASSIPVTIRSTAPIPLRPVSGNTPPSTQQRRKSPYAVHPSPGARRAFAEAPAAPSESYSESFEYSERTQRMVRAAEGTVRRVEKVAARSTPGDHEKSELVSAALSRIRQEAIRLLQERETIREVAAG